MQVIHIHHISEILCIKKLKFSYTPGFLVIKSGGKKIGKNMGNIETFSVQVKMPHPNYL